jgi:pimeloyl-ACP methyl ester carboxylesterase
LSYIKIPSLIIAGKNDPIVPPVNAQFLSERLPTNQCVLLNAEHRVWEEAANDYVDTIVSWFDSGYKTKGSL